MQFSHKQRSEFTMARQMLSNKHWSKLRKIMRNIGIYIKPNLRMTVEGIFYRIRVGCPWRDIPPEFGKWESVYQAFNRWSRKGKITDIFNLLVVEPDTEWEFIDGSYVKAHQHSTGAASSENEAIGLSRGGNTTKIHMAVDSGGLPIHFKITGGEVHDNVVAEELIVALPTADYIIADKGYDSEATRNAIKKTGASPVIPRKKNSKIGNDEMDWCLYKYRHLVENVFARLKHFRAVATRYDKLKINFESSVALAAGFLWLPM